MSDLQPRGYQLELHQQSLDRNIIITIPTGSGKTLIAALRIQSELKKTPEKRVWFLCPTVALAQQQRNALRAVIPDIYEIIILCGNDGVDHWKSDIWSRVLKNYSVVVCTYQVLTDALESGFVGISEISLLVFDEAHNCTKKNAANRIMQTFFHPSKRQKLAVPRVLGLTASAGSLKPGSLENLEANLDSISRMPSQSREEMLEYVHPPKVIVTVYVRSIQPSRILQQVVNAYTYMLRNIDKDPQVLHLRSSGIEMLDLERQSKLQDALLKGHTWCQNEAKRLLTCSRDIQQELGRWSLHAYITACLKKLHDKQDVLFTSSTDLHSQEIDYLSKSFSGIELDSQGPAITSEDSHSAKIQQLIDVIVEEMKGDTRAIIFIKTRAAVKLVSVLLSMHPLTSKILKVGTFVGASACYNKPSHVSEVIDAKGQDNVLDELRLGVKNLIVATNAVEEGIDISACNLVLCFDPPESLKSFIQRRGRAREPNSKYIIMLPEGEKSNIKKWQDFELELERLYMDEMRILKELEELESEKPRYREIFVKSTGAKITLESAVSRLHYFCQKLPNDQFSSSKPIYVYCQRPTGDFECTVHLPNSLDPQLRLHTSKSPWSSQRCAKMEAAFEAIIKLYEVRLINDNLLPAEAPNTGTLPTILGKANVVEVECQLSIWALVAEKWRQKSDIHACQLTISSPVEGHRTVQLVAPIPFPEIPDLDLYVNRDITSVARFVPEDSWKDVIDMRTANDITRLILRSGLRRRIASQDKDFAICCVPTECFENPRSWIENMSGDIPATLLDINCQTDVRDLGMIRDSSQYEAPYTLLGTFLWRDVQADTKPPDSRFAMKVRRLPKRKDFLHIPPEALPVPTTADFLDPETCSIDRLPAYWAHFALFLPSIFHYVSIHWIAEHLRVSIFRDVFCRPEDTSLILTAISTSGFRGKSNYQRLEFLGDTLLKLYVSLELLSTNPFWHEGLLTEAKKSLVSNASLADVALKIGLSPYILADAFTGTHWRPYYVDDPVANSSDLNEDKQIRQLSTKVLADVVEALLGAAWISGGEDALIKCLRIYFPTYMWQSSSDSLLLLKRRALHGPVPEPYASQLPKLTGYQFDNACIVLEALTHPSFAGVESTPSYERLEFLGDALLDVIVTLHIWSQPKSIAEKWMHRIRTATVNNPFLAFCALSQHIMVPITCPVPNTPTSPIQLKDEEHEKTLVSFLRAHAGLEYLSARDRTMQQFYKYAPEIEKGLEAGGTYPWADLAAFNPPKFMSDIVESTLAAIAIDQGNLKIDRDQTRNSPLVKFLTQIGVLPWLNCMLDGEAQSTTSDTDTYRVLHPLEELGALAAQQSPWYETWVTDSATLDPKDTEGFPQLSISDMIRSNCDKVQPATEIVTYHCRVSIGTRLLSEASGLTAYEAKLRAAVAAVALLRAGRSPNENIMKEMSADDGEVDTAHFGDEDDDDIAATANDGHASEDEFFDAIDSQV